MPLLQTAAGQTSAEPSASPSQNPRSSVPPLDNKDVGGLDLAVNNPLRVYVLTTLERTHADGRSNEIRRIADNLSSSNDPQPRPFPLTKGRCAGMISPGTFESASSRKRRGWQNCDLLHGGCDRGFRPQSQCCRSFKSRRSNSTEMCQDSATHRMTVEQPGAR